MKTFGHTNWDTVGLSYVSFPDHFETRRLINGGLSGREWETEGIRG